MQRICRVNCCLCGAPIDETLAQRWPEWMGHFRAGKELHHLHCEFHFL